jgi:CHAD domain-containing protein
MSKFKKWEIPEIKNERRFRQGAEEILAQRSAFLLARVQQFRRTNDVEDLHQLRIATRRLRYPLETLVSAFRRRSVLAFLDELNALQDLAGHARDLDVMMERLARYKQIHGWRIAKRVFADLRAERALLYQSVNDAIDLFLVSTTLYDFKQEIRFDAWMSRQNDEQTDERTGEADVDPSPAETETPGHSMENTP